MKGMLLFSLVGHLAFLGGVALVSGRAVAPREYRKVYRVKLVRAEAVPTKTSTRTSRRGTPPMRAKPVPPPKPKMRSRPTKTVPDRRKPSKKAPQDKRSDVTDAPAQRSVQTTGPVRLDAESFPFPEYLQALVDTIQTKWRLPSDVVEGSGRATVYFRILRHGSIRRAIVEAGSGARTFDRSALDAVFATDPFLPLPEGFQGEYLGVHFSFERE